MRFSFHFTDDNQFSGLNQETSLSNIRVLSPISCQLRSTFQDVLGCHGHEESAPLWHMSRERERERYTEMGRKSWTNRTGKASVMGMISRSKHQSLFIFHQMVLLHNNSFNRCLKHYKSWPQKEKQILVFADYRHLIVRHWFGLAVMNSTGVLSCNSRYILKHEKCNESGNTKTILWHFGTLEEKVDLSRLIGDVWFIFVN